MGIGEDLCFFKALGLTFGLTQLYNYAKCCGMLLESGVRPEVRPRSMKLTTEQRDRPSACYDPSSVLQRLINT
ncbi:MAG: hypothetical protein RL143_72 [Pseudomonadota bacterium]|jgi:hypothetical protein